MKYIHDSVVLSKGFSQNFFVKIKANELMDRISVTRSIVLVSIFAYILCKSRKLEKKKKSVSFPFSENNT